MVVSALNIALWDLKVDFLKCSIVDLLTASHMGSPHMEARTLACTEIVVEVRNNHDDPFSKLER
jgi:L-alanine-DL-glutamate epimerase-like enolase superfamily enzyme